MTMTARRLTVIDTRSSDLIAFPRTRIEEAGMDMTAFGHEIDRTIRQVWRTAASGDFGAMAQHLSKLEAKAQDVIAFGQAITGDIREAPAICPDHIAAPNHGRAA